MIIFSFGHLQDDRKWRQSTGNSCPKPSLSLSLSLRVPPTYPPFLNYLPFLSHPPPSLFLSISPSLLFPLCLLLSLSFASLRTGVASQITRSILPPPPPPPPLPPTTTISLFSFFPVFFPFSERLCEKIQLSVFLLPSSGGGKIHTTRL